MERRGEDVALPDGDDRPSSSLARTSTSGPVRSMIGARMNTAWTGVLPSTGNVEFGLERVELAAEGVALDADVEERQDRRLAAGDPGCEHDHPCARHEDRLRRDRPGRGSARAAPAVDELAHSSCSRRRAG
jgi:hypothetical protein